ncbi:MAG: hypothetical protein N4A35_13095 [Flavobacteriales bacterium]|jgi:hypothetical protein|nr:hypothetical protein [Flavobacteriales bacterium]
MSLLNTYANKSNAELVEILERGEDYTNDAKQASKTILEFREVGKNEAKTHASTFWKNYLKDNIKQHLLVKDQPTSYFLEDKEMVQLFRVAFKEWKEKQKFFEIDTTKYWFV